jgi:hypothetical protein
MLGQLSLHVTNLQNTMWLRVWKQIVEACWGECNGWKITPHEKVEDGARRDGTGASLASSDEAF